MDEHSARDEHDKDEAATDLPEPLLNGLPGAARQQAPLHHQLG